MDFQYWTHFKLFPHLCKIDENVFKKIHAVLVFAEMSMSTLLKREENDADHTDVGFIATDEMITQYTPDEVQRILSLVESERFKGK